MIHNRIDNGLVDPYRSNDVPVVKTKPAHSGGQVKNGNSGLQHPEQSPASVASSGRRSMIASTQTGASTDKGGVEALDPGGRSYSTYTSTGYSALIAAVICLEA